MLQHGPLPARAPLLKLYTALPRHCRHQIPHPGERERERERERKREREREKEREVLLTIKK
jgi:hypothetical protein